MSPFRFEPDEFSDYETLFDPMLTDRQARRKRKPHPHHTPKKAAHAVQAEVADSVDDAIEGKFETTYQPSKYEGGWLLDSLRAFYDQALITDVLSLVKGGKEASVYRCAAHPHTGEEFLAAKVYRPRRFRQLSNDQVYREGREVLTSEGHVAKKTDHRLMRALGKKTDYGAQVAHTSWLMYEFKTLTQLHAAGAAVPRPVGVSENSILMEYIGDAQLPAPTLNSVHLARDEANPLFDAVMRNIELMLERGMIHGDLSAYNILYWEGSVTLIDFPQVTNSYTNNSAYAILERDITRICEYFGRYGVSSAPRQITDGFWKKYVELQRRHDPAEDEDET